MEFGKEQRIIQEVSSYFLSVEREMAEAVLEFCKQESPSREIAAVTLAGDYFFKKLDKRFTGLVKRVSLGPSSPPALRIDFGNRPDVVFTGHYDTVHPLGTAKKFPARIAGGRVYGPGALDMRAGLIIATEAASTVLKHVNTPNLTLFFSPDEEIGSPGSKTPLEQIAREAEVIYLFEPGVGNTAFKTSSRGACWIEVELHGDAGHAAYPADFSNPINAYGELITFAQNCASELNMDITPTVVNAGDAKNAVPPVLTAIFDGRSSQIQTLQGMKKRFEEFQPTDPRVRSVIGKVSVSNPFGQKGDRNLAFENLVDVVELLGYPKPKPVEAQGGSDANFMGIYNENIVEGLGGWGANPHVASEEYVEVSSLSWSATLATLVAIRHFDK